MKRIEFVTSIDRRSPDFDAAVMTHTYKGRPHDARPQDVHAFTSHEHRLVPDTRMAPGGLTPPTEKLPHFLDLEITGHPAKCRAMVGNTGPELLAHHLWLTDFPKASDYLLRWARWAYRLLGKRLVLAPVVLALYQDILAGSQFLRWAADHNVTLIFWCGYRLLFANDAFDYMVKECSIRRHDWPWHPFRYPYDDVSAAIKESGVEAWTGAGFLDGLKLGAMEKAAAFGFRGVLTTTHAWEAGDAENKDKH